MREERYEIIKKIGEGGSGETYLVFDNRISEKRVMKRIFLYSEGQRGAAEREVEVLKRIRREGIPVLTDVYQEGSYLCLIMEYMPGISLSEKIKRDGCMTEREALSCGMQICQLLLCLHRMQPGIIHGDLKPANIIWQGDRVALLDFGAAYLKNTWEEMMSLESYFTPGYGAPELRYGKKPSERSDIYAFGAVLFYLVAGKRPDQERGIYPVREQNRRLSKKLEKLILKCCEEKPDKRYRSMEEVEDILRRLLYNRKRNTGMRQWMDCKEGEGYRYGKMFVVLKSIVLAEGNWEKWMILVLLLLLLKGDFGNTELLPVNMRTKNGDKFLVNFNSTYIAKENPIFEIPLSFMKKNQKYDVTISMFDGEEKKRYARTFVICAD